ncbi:hypothetical protein METBISCDRAFT_27819 [Metschnikowia bicuspidata]|uniref:Uncharacterized protein n=1 Tax=Metschnikowia bicuspidata TaxID=27322 RepID=A0A4P9ZB08_9ASCO|nr:hypothetical protein METBISCDRAFT_27819 [Metschnikowia bicuspidata]
MQPTEFPLEVATVKEENPADRENPETANDVTELTDYSKLYDTLLNRFNTVYHQSQTLHMTNKMQRQALYHYKRRNNALLDFIRVFDDPTYDDLDVESMPVDAARIESLVAFEPSLKVVLAPAVQIAKSVPASEIKLDHSFGANLAVDELIPELPYDELEAAEKNPQDIGIWSRRNFSHLVVSKFRPADVRARGVRDYASSDNLKRRRRKDA